MKRYNYGSELATGAVASGGGLGILMPPSVVMIVYGFLTEQSIGRLFIAGILPAVVITIIFIVAIAIYCKIRPEQGPKGERFSLKEMVFSVSGLWETLAVFSFVMGGLFFGIFTPTKAGAVGACSILVIVVLQRKLSWEGFLSSIYDSLKTSCMVLMLIAGATLFGHFLALTRIPLEVANWVGELPWPDWAIIAMICFVYLIGGCFIDALALIMLTIPIFYPITVNLGYDPIWFGVIIVLVTQMGIITPPVGVNVYVVNGIAKDVPLETVFKGCMPFLLALVVGTGVMIVVPILVTYLPGLVR